MFAYSEVSNYESIKVQKICLIISSAGSISRIEFGNVLEPEHPVSRQLKLICIR